MKFLLIMAAVFDTCAIMAALGHHWFQAELELLIGLLYLQLYTERRWP